MVKPTPPHVLPSRCPPLGDTPRSPPPLAALALSVATAGSGAVKIARTWAAFAENALSSSAETKRCGTC